MVEAAWQNWLPCPYFKKNPHQVQRPRDLILVCSIVDVGSKMYMTSDPSLSLIYFKNVSKVKCISECFHMGETLKKFHLLTVEARVIMRHCF